MRLLYARLAARNYCGPAFRWFAPYRVKAVDLGRFDGAPGIHVRKRFKKEKHHERRKQENRKDRAGSKAGREGSEADRVVGAGSGQSRGWRRRDRQVLLERQKQPAVAFSTLGTSRGLGRKGKAVKGCGALCPTALMAPFFVDLHLIG